MPAPENAPPRSLKILAVSSLLPYPPDNGGITRLYNLYLRLAQHHQVTWVSPVYPGTEEYVPQVETFCRRLVPLPLSDQIPFPSQGVRRLWFRVVARLKWERLFVYNYGYVQAPGLYWLPASPERLATIRALVESEPFDVIVSEFEGTAEMTSWIRGIPKVIVLHNTLSTLFERARQTGPTTWEDKLFYGAELHKIRRYERKNYAAFDLGITCSQHDRELLRRRCPDLPGEIIPNGVDAQRFTPQEFTGQNNRLMYFGHYGYPPNADAVLYFGREILPLIRQRRPDVRTWAVGHMPPAEFHAIDGLDVVGSVPDVRPYLAQADVIVVPLRAGSGTRLKILEAMAMGKAVVSTTLGAEGLDVTNGKDILLADRPEDFTDCALRLLEQPELRRSLGEHARRLVEREYDWGPIASRLEQALQNVVAQGKKPHANG